MDNSSFLYYADAYRNNLENTTFVVLQYFESGL